MSVHTPGPWCQCEPLADHMQDSGSRRIHAHFDCDCKVAWFGGEPQKAHSRAVRYLPATDADAALMAAAPELLEALKGLRERCDYSDLRAWADDVIAKAEGRGA